MKWSSVGRDRHSRFLHPSLRFKLSGTIPEPVYVGPGDTQLARRVHAQMAASKWVGVDTEYVPETNDMVLWSISDGKSRVCLHPSALPMFKELLERDAAPKKVFHNALADLPVFEKCGIHPVVGADTMVTDFYVDENRKKGKSGGGGHGLKACAFDWLGIEMREFKDVFGGGSKQIDDVRGALLRDIKVTADYASLDAYATYWLLALQRRVLAGMQTSQGSTLWKVFRKYELPYLMSLHDINITGFALDTGVLEQIGQELDRTVARCTWVSQYHLPEKIAVPRNQKGKKFHEDFTREQIGLANPNHLAALFYDVLERESPNPRKPRSTEDSTLSVWAAQGCVISSIVRAYKKAHKQRKDFIGYREADPRAPQRAKSAKPPSSISRWMCQEYSDGGPWIIRTSMNPVGAVTGRNSASRPPMQQVPSRAESDPYKIRRAFVARPGCCLVVADYDIAEMRVLAHLSADKRMVKLINDGVDLHSATAKVLFKLDTPTENIKTEHGDLRKVSKTINFGVAYGMGPLALSMRLGVSLQEAERFIATFYRTYKGVDRWMRATEELAGTRGYVETILGRRRRFPFLRLMREEDPFDKAIGGAERQAVNAPIQGSVSDILRVAMAQVRADPYLREAHVKTLLQVHDELIVECPTLVAYQVEKRLKEIMEGAVQLRVPLKVDAHVAPNWAEGKQ